MSETLQSRIDDVAQIAMAICATLEGELSKMGFAPNEVSITGFTEADFHLARDPASGADSLIGIWRDARGNKCGELLFHADGSFFVEHDVIHPHPGKPRWFVEAVTAWGRAGTIKSEPRLLPAID